MKRILSVLLCVLLIASLLCGCGGSSKTEAAPREDAYKASSGSSGASYAAADSGAGWAMEAPEAEAPTYVCAATLANKKK